MRVKVLARDIENGVALDCRKCPIALAVRRMVKHTRVKVDANINVGAKYYRIPAIARRFMDRFDSYKNVKPITFSCQAR